MPIQPNELRYLEKLITSDSDLQIEAILDLINSKRDQSDALAIDELQLVIQKIIEKLEGDDDEEKSSGSSALKIGTSVASNLRQRLDQTKKSIETEDAMNLGLAVSLHVLEALLPTIESLLSPRPPKDYVILSSKGQAHLAVQVKQYIKMGYQPLGGVSAAAFGISPVGGNQYIQAVVRY
jgi:hypothetical protein